MRIDVLTLFPAAFESGPLDVSIIKRAREDGLLDLQVHDIREHATDRHRSVDDYPFGGGPRLCIGNGFAMVEAAIIIATVAQRYSLRNVSDQPVAVEPGVTLRPKHGLPVRLEKRPLHAT